MGKLRKWLPSDKHQHVIALLLAVSLTPFFRGGRDSLGLLVPMTCLFLAALLLALRPQAIKRLAVPAAPLALAGLFVAWKWLSIAWAPASYDAVVAALYWTFGLLAGVLVALYIQKNQDRHVLLGYVVAGGVVTALFGIYLFVTLPFDRAASFFYWPNPLALYLLLVFLAGWYLQLQKKGRAVLTALVLIAATFMLTQSLATFVLAAVALTAGIFLFKPERKQLKTLAVVLLAALMLSQLVLVLKNNVLQDLSVGTPDEIGEFVGLKTSGVGDRFDYWRTTFDLWQEDPLAGKGGGSFGTAYPQQQESLRLSVSDPHNIYLLTLLENGIIGLALLLGFLGSAGLALWRNRNHAWLPGVIMVAAWLLHAGFYQTGRYPVLLAWLFAALALALAPRIGMPYRRWMLPSLVAMLMVLLVPTYALFQSEYYKHEADFSAAQFDYERAIQGYKLASEQLIYDPDVLSASAWPLVFTERPELAAQRAQQAIEQDPQDASHYFRYAFVLNITNQKERAKEMYRKTIELDRLNYPRAYVGLTVILLNEGKIRQAQTLLDDILPKYDYDTVISRAGADTDLPRQVALLHFHRARIANFNGETQREVQELRAALKLQPEFTDALEQLEFLGEEN